VHEPPFAVVDEPIDLVLDGLRRVEYIEVFGDCRPCATLMPALGDPSPL
jgi:hypothetical protein